MNENINENIKETVQGYLLEKVEKYRIDTEEMVVMFINQVKKDSYKEGYELVSYASAKKEKKSKGEIVDEYWIVTIKKKF